MKIEKIIAWILIIGGIILMVVSPQFIWEHCSWSGSILAIGVIAYVEGLLNIRIE